jgi:hypothetical protein
VLVVLIALTSGRALDARAVAAGEREHYANLPGGFDPRPPIAAIERSGYRVCYADYWIAYKLQWITEERVRFIVSHGYTRNRPEAALLLREPGEKCYVDYEGNVSAGPPLRRPVPRASVAR